MRGNIYPASSWNVVKGEVNSFPTYKLVAPQGNVPDIKVSPYYHQALEEVIKQLTN